MREVPEWLVDSATVGMTALAWASPIAAVLVLAACATQPKPQPVATVSCLPLKAYTPAEQKALADQLSSIQPDSPLAKAVIELERMRDADRACLASRQ